LGFSKLERVAVLVISVVLAAALIILLSGGLGGLDQGGLSGSSSTVGESFPDQGDATLRPGQPSPRYDSQPPTSGPHRRAPVNGDRRELGVDQLLTALAAGDVVVDYGTRRPPPGLAALASRLAGGFTSALAADGQAVVLARRPGTTGLTALAWTRALRVSSPADPLLRQFIQTWLGRGARGG
jgi:hypothetical protein